MPVSQEVPSFLAPRGRCDGTAAGSPPHTHTSVSFRTRMHACNGWLSGLPEGQRQTSAEFEGGKGGEKGRSCKEGLSDKKTLKLALMPNFQPDTTTNGRLLSTTPTLQPGRSLRSRSQTRSFWPLCEHACPRLASSATAAHLLKLCTTPRRLDGFGFVFRRGGTPSSELASRATARAAALVLTVKASQWILLKSSHAW